MAGSMPIGSGVSEIIGGVLGAIFAFVLLIILLLVVVVAIVLKLKRKQAEGESHCVLYSYTFQDWP